MAMARGGYLHASSQFLQHKLCPLVRVHSTHQHHIHHHLKLNLLRLPLSPSSGTRTRANATIATASALSEVDGDPSAAASILDKLRSKQIRDRHAKPKPSTLKKKAPSSSKPSSSSTPVRTAEREPLPALSTFRELPLSEELLAAMDELHLAQPTEVQCRAIPAVLDGRSVVVASHTGSGKTLAYMIPIVQCLRKDEIEHGKVPRPRRPRAVVLCPTRELAEQVFRVAKTVSHHARFRVALIGGGVRMKPQEDALNSSIDMLVGTPGRLLKHIEDRNVAYGDIKYVVLDEADTMFDRGFGPDVRKFLSPLRNRSTEGEGFQAVLVTATITKGVQKLLDDEFPGIKHIRTSSLHKKISTAKHGFIKLAGTENKLESLLQVLEPSLAKGDRVMVFCNTLNSCRAVDHFLNENNVQTVNYHGAVPAEERVEVLNKFRSEEGKCPSLVCTDLAARGLDLVVDHVIMFDFPLNSIDYLHRTGRTARMGAKGKITSLVTKRSLALAEQIEDAIHKGESLECISAQREESKAPAMKSRRVGRAGNAKMGTPLRSSRARGPPSRSARPAAPRTKGAPARGTKPVVSASTKSPLVRISKKYPVVRVPKAKAPASDKLGPKNMAKKAPKRAMKVSGRR